MWATAKPYLESWMQDQLGWQGFARNLEKEAPYFARMIPAWPRLITQVLERASAPPENRALDALIVEQRRLQRLVLALAVLVAALLGWEVWRWIVH